VTFWKTFFSFFPNAIYYLIGAIYIAVEIETFKLLTSSCSQKRPLGEGKREGGGRKENRGRRREEGRG
jgi:hypothetical protein